MLYPKAIKPALYVKGSGFYVEVRNGAQIVLLGCVEKEPSLYV